MQPYRSIWRYLFDVPHTLGWADVDGIKTRYIQAGNVANPPLMLLHGTAGSIENFSANIGHYARDFNVFAIDMLGCGLTDKPDFDYHYPDYGGHAIGFMDAMEIPIASFVGVSMGSGIACWMALNYPGRVDKIVMVAPAGIITDRAAFEKSTASGRERRMKATGDATWGSVREVFKTLFLHEEDIIDDLIAIRLAIYERPEMQKAMPHLLASSDGSHRLQEDDWKALPNEILAIVAIDKQNMFIGNARRIAELAPHAKTLEIPECDHWAQFEQADIFNALSTRFLKGEAIPERVDRSELHEATGASGR